MALPQPHPGLVIRYAYLWANEQAGGRVSGVKDRPCAIILAQQIVADRPMVTVVAVTHTPPMDEAEAIEIPPAIKRQLGLDELRSWIVLSEVNDFLWPGADLSPVPGSDPARFDYGTLPPGYFRSVRDRLVALARQRRVRRIPRTE